MPNAIKYSTTGDTLSLKKGNIFFGVGDVGKGPSSATTYYNGVTPPSSGYTIYSYNAAQTSNLSFHTAVNDSALITYTNGVSGQNFSTATQCLNWYATQSNYVCVNRDYEGIVTNGLVLNVDAGFTPSYTSSGTTWYDLSYSGNNGTLTNGPSYSSSSGGTIVLDGTNDYINCGNGSSLQITSNITVETWVYLTSLTNSSDLNLISKYSNTGGASFQGWILFKSTGDYTSYGPGGSGGPNNNEFAWLATSDGNFNGALIGTGEQVSVNTWYQVVGVFISSSNTIQIYVNGQLKRSGVRTNQTSGVLLNAARNINIGATPEDNARFVQGNIATSRVYNRALTSSEVLQNYNAQVSRFSPSYDSDAQAFFTAAGITDTTQKNAVNQLVLDLKSYSLWNKMNAIYPFVGGTATTHKYNLKDPRDLNVAYRLSFAGGWTHSSNGVTPNGVNGYADTYFDGNVGAIGCYNRNTSFAMGTKYDEWEGGDYPVYSIPWIYLLGRGGTIQNTVDQNNVVNPAGATLPFAHITYDTQQRLYTNGNLVNSNAFYTSAPSAPTGYPIWIGGLNDNGRFNNPTYYGGTSSFSFISGTLNSTESANLNTAVQAFQTTLGRNV